MGKLHNLLFGTQTRRLIFLVASGIVFGILLPATRVLLYKDGGTTLTIIVCGFVFLSAVSIYVEQRCRRRAVAVADSSEASSRVAARVL